MKTSDAPVDYRLNRIHYRPPMTLGRAEAEDLLDLAEQFRARLFVNADRAVALHIGMAPDGTDARAGPANVAA